MDQTAHIQRLINTLEEQRNKAMSDAAVASSRADVLAVALEQANARITELETKAAEIERDQTRPQ